MSSFTVPKPGLVCGHYPEHQPAEDHWLQRFTHASHGCILRMFPPGKRDYLKFLAEVNRHGEAMERLANQALIQAIQAIKVDLNRFGFVDHVVARAFALVREIAHREVGMRHYDVQILAGWLMLRGKIAEMQTGEGKTLTATLPVATAAMAGTPVHVITVNDYLVQRDLEEMRPIYAKLGLTSGCILEGMDAPTRQAAYRCDITYCSNKQLVFDYLKDRLVLGGNQTALRMHIDKLNDDSRNQQLLLRGLCFAIVDEADSVLIDEARTPLIISREIDIKDQETAYQQALSIAAELQIQQDFSLDVRSRSAEITAHGRHRITELTNPLGGLWKSRRRSQELVQQALSAQHLFLRDKHYIVRDDKVQIVDEHTGRTMADRSWERGLHQMIEAKEGCPISKPKETIAKISYQQFFRRYLRLAGMTGTAKEVAAELWNVYRLDSVKVPTNRPAQRRQFSTRVFQGSDEKWRAIVDRIDELALMGRPVLVGTRSVAASEHLSRLLLGQGLEHQVLNALQDAHEADIVRRAGEGSRITVATNMAGRGTDIKLTERVKALGGLHVIATEIHESSRIDRQLFGRCGRQGDPGSFELILALDDEIVRTFTPALLLALVKGGSWGLPDLAGNSLRWIAIRWAQKSAERHHWKIRQHTLMSDNKLNTLLAFSGRSA